MELALRIACLCLLLAGVETVHGIARMRWLVPRIGKARAHRVSIVTGSLLAFATCLALVPSLGLRGTAPLLLLGAGLAVFMAGFDITIGRFAARMPWSVIWADFNPAKGNLLSAGLALLVFLPLLAMWLLG